MADEYKHKGRVVCCVCSCMLAQWRATVVAISHCITWFQTQLSSATPVSCGICAVLHSTERRVPTLSLVLGQ